MKKGWRKSPRHLDLPLVIIVFPFSTFWYYLVDSVMYNSPLEIFYRVEVLKIAIVYLKRKMSPEGYLAFVHWFIIATHISGYFFEAALKRKSGTLR